CAIAGVAGAPVEAMRAVATTMVGIEHRLEFVREHQGVRYYNDSIATSPERAMAALRAFDEPVVLLAGGRDKHLPWDAWADLALEKARHLVVFGEVQPIVERAIATAQLKGQRDLRESLWMRSVETLGEAVAFAASLARPGEVVLLSPGGTSFDEFKDFAERGDRFRMLVQDL
ncbi:MAG: UDP-N-acetylmuramoyl-L-alanine--D-glutamate ligase, partial [Anaerolineae bacterium]|nr:UDP-N-acetylmuramoyl-L-alanine--D-glutamate ligase [Anaerolineae bacterium]